MTDKPQHGIQSIEVGMRVLDAFADGPQDMTLTSIAAAADMPPSKAHRYLVSLIRSGYVEQVPASSRYRLGRGALAIGLASLRHVNVVELGAPILKELRDATGLTVSMAVWANHGPTVVRVIESTNPMIVTVRVGTVLPLLTSANGLLFLAHLPQSETGDMMIRESQAMSRQIRARLPDTPDEMIEQVRAEGLARNFQMHTIGLNAIAAPAFDAQGELACTMAVIGAASELNMDLNGATARAVRAAGVELTERLGGRMPGPMAGAAPAGGPAVRARPL